MNYTKWRIFKRDLRELSIRFDNQYSLNSGGCCWYCGVLARHLDKLGIRYRLKIYSWDWISEEDFLADVKNKERYIESHNHYTLVIQNFNINPGNSNRQKYVFNNINAEDLEHLYNAGDWNYNFNKKYCKVIEKELNSFFKQYEKE